MVKPILILTVWALLAASLTQAQHNDLSLSSSQVLMPMLFNTSAHHEHSIIVEKKHRHRSAATGYAINGDTMFTGGYKNGRLHGEWSSWYHPQYRCDSGRLVKSIPDGEWKSWYNNGRLRSVRTYSAQRLGRVQYELPRRSGKATFLTITDIARNDAEYAYRLLTPFYSYFTLATNAASAKAPTPRNLADRVLQNTSGEKRPYLAPFTTCLHHGLYMNYYPDGSVKDSGFYKDGVRDGVWIEKLDSGAIASTGAYRRGFRYDTWKFYDRSGNLLYIKWYKKGKETGWREW